LDASHRLIPSRHSESGTVLADIVDSDEMLEDIVLLDGATNDRIQGEQQGLIGISTYELVYGIPNAHVVNAAFTHTNESGSRFNDQTRGAWYAAEELETSLAEVTYHKARRLAEIVVPGLPGQRPDQEASTLRRLACRFPIAFSRVGTGCEFLRVPATRACAPVLSGVSTNGTPADRDAIEWACLPQRPPQRRSLSCVLSPGAGL